MVTRTHERLRTYIKQKRFLKRERTRRNSATITRAQERRGTELPLKRHNYQGACNITKRANYDLFYLMRRGNGYF
jgi:hypothetical protein